MQNSELALIFFVTAAFSFVSHQFPRYHQLYDDGTNRTALRSVIAENCYDRILILVCKNHRNTSSSSSRELLDLITSYSFKRGIPFFVIEPAVMVDESISRNECANISSGGEDEFVVTYIVSRRAFTTNWTTNSNFTKYLAQWLNAFHEAANVVKQVNAKELDEYLQRQNRNKNDESVVLLLLIFSNQCPLILNTADSTKTAEQRWAEKFAESLVITDQCGVQFTVLLMDVDDDDGVNSDEMTGWNRMFLRYRLPTIQHDLEENGRKCPRLILLKQGRYYIDYHHHNAAKTVGSERFANLYENTSIVHLRNFVTTTSDSPMNQWIEIGDSLTDVQYIFYTQEYAAQENIRNKKFIAIGITGGIDVIALAISIFWGLKSSS